jgi:hypothetical protein
MLPNVQSLLMEHIRIVQIDDPHIDRDSSIAQDTVAVLSLEPGVRALMLPSSPAVKDAERARDVGATGFTPPGPPAA